LKNFARGAALNKKTDFPVAIQNVATRLGVSFQHVSKLRQRFVDAFIIEQTAAAVTNRSAARFRWRLPTDQGSERWPLSRSVKPRSEIAPGETLQCNPNVE
jgi:hypothetical protein